MVAAMPLSNSGGFTPDELAALNLWRLPDFFDEEDISVTPEQDYSASGHEDTETASEEAMSTQESVALLTVEEIEAMQKLAYEEAFAQGKEEGLKQGYDDGYQQGHQLGYDTGLQKGYDENLEKLTSKAGLLAGLMETLSEPFKQLDEEVEKELISLAIAMANQIIRREIKLNPGEVVAAARAAIKVLPLSAQKINLYLHPEDAELVRTALALDEMATAWSIVEDPIITRGGCVVKTEVSVVNATIEHRLAAVIANMLGSEREQDHPV